MIMWWIEAAGPFVGGALGGSIAFAWGWAARGKQPRRPMCSCEHGLGSHEQPMGKCHAEVRRTIRGYERTFKGYTWVPCPCLAYDGPDPLLLA